jgi:flagellar P-ring protein precursor FlgI
MILKAPTFVIPAKAGTHLPPSPLPQRQQMDPRLRGDDEIWLIGTSA